MDVRVVYFSGASSLAHEDADAALREFESIAPVTRVPMLDETRVEPTPAIRHLFARAYPAISRTELAHMLMHIAQWAELFASSTASYYWICEAGVVLPSAAVFTCIRDALSASMKIADVLYVGSKCSSSQEHLRAEMIDVKNLALVHDIPRSYLISKAGARRLLDDIQKNGVRGGGLSAVLLRCPGLKILRSSCPIISKDINASASGADAWTPPLLLDLTFGEHLVFIEAYDVIGCDVGARPAQHAVALILRPQQEWDAVNTLGFYKQGAVLPRAWVRFPSCQDGVFVRSARIDCDTRFVQQNRIHGIACPALAPCAKLFRPSIENEVGDAFCVPAAAACSQALTSPESLRAVLALPAAARVHMRCNWDAVNLPAFMRTHLPSCSQWGRLAFVDDHEPADFIVYFANVVQHEANTMELRLEASVMCNAQKTLVFPIVDYSDALRPVTVHEPVWPSASIFLYVHSLAHNRPVATWQHVSPLHSFETLPLLGSQKPEPDNTQQAPEHVFQLAHYNPDGNTVSIV
jgi:hypothetical protein